MPSYAYTHLNDDVVPLLDATDEERVRHIQADRFIAHGVVRAVLNILDDFVARPVSIRPPCLALVGDSGSGKSSLLDEFMRRTTPGTEAPRIQRAAYFVADALPTQSVLQAALLTALGSPRIDVERRSRYSADDLIHRAIAELGTRVVVVDEVQHILNLPLRDRYAVWDWIKWISTANRVSVVASGIPGSEAMIVSERQLQTRFEVVHLPRWVVGPAFAQFLEAYERSLPLKRASGLASPEMQEALLAESFAKQQVTGITTGVKQVIEAAAVLAIRNGEERITRRLLPAWRSAFERAA
jgi:Bacterial TniB protein